jgi:ribonuclease T
VTGNSDEADASTADADPIASRFRGFLPVVVDVETGGFNSATDALLEVGAVLLELDTDGELTPGEAMRYHVRPFEGARLEPASLQVTGIDPWHPLRPAIDEGDALRALFKRVRREVKTHECKRAILVGHNAFFDLQFINAAVERSGVKRNPFHPFSSFDTVTLAGCTFGQTVLSRAVAAAGIEWDDSQAHSALYDATMTARLFCECLRQIRRNGSRQASASSPDFATRSLSSPDS